MVLIGSSARRCSCTPTGGQAESLAVCVHRSLTERLPEPRGCEFHVELVPSNVPAILNGMYVVDLVRAGVCGLEIELQFSDSGEDERAGGYPEREGLAGLFLDGPSG